MGTAPPFCRPAFQFNLLLISALIWFSALPTRVPAQSAAERLTAPAAGTKPAASSLDFVPAATDYYFATSNHSAIWRAVTESRAYEALKSSPAGKKMRKAYRKGLTRGWSQFGENPFRYYLEGYANSIDSLQGKVLLPYLERLLANELFFYANDRSVPFARALRAFYDESSARLLTAGEDSVDDEQIWKAISNAADKHLKDVVVPTLVVGAIAEEPEVFVGFIEVIKSGFDQLVAENPEQMALLANAARFGKEGTSEEDLFAWFGLEFWGDQLPLDQLVLADPDLAELVGAFKSMFAGKRFAVGFAVRGQAVLLTFGPSLEHLRQLGTQPLLCELPQLAPLRQARTENQRLCQISFQSAEFAKYSAGSLSSWIPLATNLFGEILAGLEGELLSESEKDELLRSFKTEAERFTSELRGLEPTIGGPLFSYAALTSEGIEGYRYELGLDPGSDPDRELLLSRRVNAPPMLLLVDRSETAPQYWQTVDNYLKKFFAGIEQYGPLMAEDLEQAEISAIVLERLAPLLKRLSKLSFGDLLPRMSGAEWGVVIDFSVARTRWHAALPESSVPLPLPGVVLLMSSSDSAAMKRSGEQYLELARQAIEDLKELSGGEVPESIELPDPETTTLPFGQQFGYPLPSELGLTKEWLPHVVIGQQLLAIGYFPEQTARLLGAGEALENNRPWFGPAGEAGPSSNLLLVDNRQLADAVEAWTYYGLQQAKAEGLPVELEVPADAPDLNLNETELRETLTAGFNFYRCFQGFSSRTYRSGEARIQHYLLKFSDSGRE